MASGRASGDPVGFWHWVGEYNGAITGRRQRVAWLPAIKEVSGKARGGKATGRGSNPQERIVLAENRETEAGKP